MAFNPFHAFQKNKKFWMAAILLVTMVTFVFCTGTRGDMQDKIINMFRKRGSTLVSVGSYNLTLEDLYALRDERNMVNEFMRRCTQATADNLGRIYQEESKKPLPTEKDKREKQQAELGKLVLMQQTLMDRMRKPRYFEGGIKLDDLIEFKIWEIQADRLRIRLQEEDVDLMTRLAFYSPSPDPRYWYITYEQFMGAQVDARRGKDYNEARFHRALANEFRVHLAKLAVLEMQVSRFAESRLPPPFFIDDPRFPDQQRVPVSLAQLLNVYKEKRSEFDVTLIPVHVADFTTAVFDEKKPSDAELDTFYTKNRTNKYDPTSPFPSFETPQEIKIEYLMADPTSGIYLGAARAVMMLQTTLPLVGSNAGMLAIGADPRALAFEAGRLKAADDILEGMTTPNRLNLFGTADLASPHFLWQLGAYYSQHDPAAIASLIGNAASSYGDPVMPGGPAWAGFVNIGMHRPELTNAGKEKPYSQTRPELDVVIGPDGKVIKEGAGIAAEEKRRIKPYAQASAAFAIGNPYGGAAALFRALDLQVARDRANFMQYEVLSTTPMLLPLPLIQRDLEKVVENRLAEQWATRNLLAIKKLTDKAAKPDALRRILKENVDKYGLTLEHSTGWVNRYTIDKDPGLKDLRDAYEKYYGPDQPF